MYCKTERLEGKTAANFFMPKVVGQPFTSEQYLFLLLLLLLAGCIV